MPIDWKSQSLRSTRTVSVLVRVAVRTYSCLAAVVAVRARAAALAVVAAYIIALRVRAVIIARRCCCCRRQNKGNGYDDSQDGT